MLVKKMLSLLVLLALNMAMPAWAENPGRGAAAARPLTKKEITTALAQLDRALRTRNVDGYMSLVDPAAELHLLSPVAQATQAMTPSYQDYRNMVAQSFADARSYEVKRESVSVTLLPDGRALATDMLLETIRLPNKTFKSITSERLLFARRDGKARIVGLASEQVSSSQK